MVEGCSATVSAIMHGIKQSASHYFAALFNRFRFKDRTTDLTKFPTRSSRSLGFPETFFVQNENENQNEPEIRSRSQERHMSERHHAHSLRLLREHLPGAAWTNMKLAYYWSQIPLVLPSHPLFEMSMHGALPGQKRAVLVHHRDWLKVSCLSALPITSL